MAPKRAENSAIASGRAPFIPGHIGRVEVLIRHYRSVDIIENGDLRPLGPADAREYWLEMADLIAQFAAHDDPVALLECAHSC